MVTIDASTPRRRRHFTNRPTLSMKILVQLRIATNSRLHGGEIMRPPVFTHFHLTSLTDLDTPHPCVAFAGTDGHSRRACDRQDTLSPFLFPGSYMLPRQHALIKSDPILSGVDNQDSEEQVHEGECPGGETG